jgi:hypothetical protein
MANFENLLARLIEHRVEFVLVGGFAATAYGSTLLTPLCRATPARHADNEIRRSFAVIPPDR